MLIPLPPGTVTIDDIADAVARALDEARAAGELGFPVVIEAYMDGRGAVVNIRDAKTMRMVMLTAEANKRVRESQDAFIGSMILLEGGLGGQCPRCGGRLGDESKAVQRRVG